MDVHLCGAKMREVPDGVRHEALLAQYEVFA
jgi:hypothetical protein